MSCDDHFDDSGDSDSDVPVLSMTSSDDELQEPQDLLENHINTCMSLYDKYIAILADALVKHPELSDIECNTYTQVLLRPGHEVQLDDMASTRLRELFFDYYIADRAIPALRAHLLTI